MTNQSNVFNIPANYHFFESLLFWLEQKFSDKLSQVKILLPNQRSCHELKKLILSKNFTGILPKIKAVSDLSFEDFYEFFNEKEEAHFLNEEVKKAIDEILQIKALEGIESLFFLTEQIQKLTIFGNLNFDQSFKISIHLKALFDQIESEEINLIKLEEIDDSNLSKHRLVTLEFLKDFYAQIKNSLLKQDLLFSSSYQNFIVEKFQKLVTTKNLRNPLIIAGSTGSISSTRKLIKTIKNQPNGFVVLYGLFENDSESKIEQENHPQFFLNKLIEFLEIKKNSIINLKEKKFCISAHNRQNLIVQMMKPSINALSWQSLDHYFETEEVRRDLKENFQIIEVENEIKEANALTQIIHKCYLGTSSVGLISNNENLLNLIKLNLQNLGICFNDSRNLRVFDSPLINFLLLILEAKESQLSSHTLLALLKSPLCQFSKNQELISEFEIKILRQDLSNQGIDGIKEKLQKNSEENLRNFFNEFLSLLPENQNLSSLIKSAEKLTLKSWSELLEKESAQQEIFEFFEKLESLNYQLSSTKEFKLLLTQISFFSSSDSSSLVQILSSIEARLLNFDLVIVASLNENDFPKIDSENWLGKKINKDLGIDQSMKKLGQNALDFCNYLSNRKVVLSRSRSQGSVVLLESPFLLKFKTITQKIGVNFSNPDLGLSQKNKTRQQKTVFCSPKPEKEFRPKKFSITEISKLISDPYFIYAKKVLQLGELKKIDYEPGYSEFGSFVHKALEEFVKDQKEENFVKIFEKYFCAQEAKLVWLVKFEKIFSDFKKENQLFANLSNSAELALKMMIGEVLISGKIDRIVFNQEDSTSIHAKIFDYKTGQTPSKKSVLNGTDPQLAICALLLGEHLKSQNKNVKINSLNYWKISPSQGNEIINICQTEEEVNEIITATKQGLEKLFEHFSKEENAFNASQMTKNSEYKHLARID